MDRQMAMKQIKVSEATGIGLDWLVAKCEGALAPLGNVQLIEGKWLLICVGGDPDHGGSRVYFNPSTDWAQGGPIKEREKIGTNWVVSNYQHIEGCWSAYSPQQNGKIFYATTELIAAMRCYVTRKLGETAEVPEELV